MYRKNSMVQAKKNTRNKSTVDAFEHIFDFFYRNGHKRAFFPKEWNKRKERDIINLAEKRGISVNKLANSDIHYITKLNSFLEKEFGGIAFDEHPDFVKEHTKKFNARRLAEKKSIPKEYEDC